jgi:hypothetical protein
MSLIKKKLMYYGYGSGFTKRETGIVARAAAHDDSSCFLVVADKFTDIAAAVMPVAVLLSYQQQWANDLILMQHYDADLLLLSALFCMLYVYVAFCTLVSMPYTVYTQCHCRDNLQYK